jgi:hypothetical protein
MPMTQIEDLEIPNEPRSAHGTWNIGAVESIYSFLDMP